MNKMRYLLALVLVVMAGSSSAQLWKIGTGSNGEKRWVHEPFPDRGYWVLTNSEVRGYHLMVGSNMIDDMNYWPYGESVPESKAKPFYGDWSVKKNHASCEECTVTWNDPPDKIPVGQEHRAVIPYSKSCLKTKKRNRQVELIPQGDESFDSDPVYYEYCPWSVFGEAIAYGKRGQKQRNIQMWPYDWSEQYFEKEWVHEEGFLNQDFSAGSDILMMGGHDYMQPTFGSEAIPDDKLCTLDIAIFAHYDFHSVKEGVNNKAFDGQDARALRKNYGWMYVYHYTYVPEGGLIETTTTASSDPGEQEGPEIPWGFIVGGTVLVGGSVAIAKSKNKKGKNKPAAKEQPEEPVAKAPSRFRMVMYKDFGDTLVVGEKPRMVGARIEEITPEGYTYDRDDLTAQISIWDEENCTLSNVGRWGRYMAAGVTAKEAPREGQLGQAKVRFVFRGAHGVLINHVIFKVMGAPEIVIGEALTFAAGDGKTEFMEFQIVNFSGTVSGVQVSIDERGAQYFKAQTEPNSENPYKFRINITECGVKPSEKPIGGDAQRFTCKVEVKLADQEDPVYASFDLYRMFLGVSLFVHALKAYLVEYDSNWKSERLPMGPNTRKKWGESAVTFKLVVEDQRNGQIKSVIPDGDPVFTFEDIQEGSMMFADKEGNLIASVCQLMNFKFDLVTIHEDNTVRGVFRSRGGGLLPPNRAKAKVTITVSYQNKSYSDSVEVPIISQPYRDITDNREYSRVLHEDDQKYKQLVDIRSKIAWDPKFAYLTPIYYKVHAMVEGYSQEFGFYEPDYQKIKKIYQDYVSGKIGYYFVNQAAWTPTWSAADENLDAFITTYGNMEKTWTFLGARIALGFFTAGASELVFTPASGLVKLKDYVDKGGDSAFEGFATVSSEVVFWEGVFYVGGKAMKWAGGKLKSFSDKIGLTDKLKTKYDKIKEMIFGAEKSKNVSKGLVKPPTVNTKQLGDKVKEAGSKVKNIRRDAAIKANQAIKQTIEEGGDDVVRFGSSEFNEECAKWAKQDAEKILENFKRVMNDPTATPEQMRRATLALQGNKAAQNLLRQSESDLLRANFNANLKKIYQEADQLTIEELAARLGVNKDDIRVWDGASSNASSDLYYGKKIGADRDVTFQVRKDGKWVDIREDIMEQAYADAFTEYHYGFMPKDQQEAVKTLRKFDQAVVNGETGLESFGKDLRNIIDKGMQTNKLIDPERVAKTVKYKCDFWLNQGKSCRAQAEQLFNAGMVEEAKHVMGYGEELVKEGVRMNVKEFKRILDPRIQALNVKGVAPKDYSLLYEKIKVLEAVGTPPPKDVTPLSLQQARNVLMSKYGTTLEEVVNECTNVIEEVNPYL
jgi:hypothetical protein